MPRRRRRAVAVAITTLVLGVTALAAAPDPDPAAAQEQPTALRLVRQTPWVEPDGTLQLELAVDGPVPADAELALSLHQRISARSAFQPSIDGELGSVLAALTAVPIADVPRGAAGSLVVELPLRRPSTPATPGRYRLSQPGVYPVRVELRTPDGDALAGLTTHLVRLPEQSIGPALLAVAVLPVAAPPALQPDGAVVLPEADRARISAVVGALVTQPAVPAVVAPVPETLEALSNGSSDVDAVLVESMGAALAGRQLVAGTYVPLDVTAWYEAGRGDEVALQRQQGADVLADLLSVRPDGRTWLADARLTPDTLGALGVDQVVVPEEILTPVDQPLTLAEPFGIEVAPGQVRRAVQADGALAAHLPTSSTTTGDPVLAAQHVLSDLAVIFFESPSVQRAVVLVPPADWTPTPELLDTLLSGLAGGPIVQPATVDDVFAVMPPATDDDGEPLVRGLVPEPPSPLGGFPAALDRTREQVIGFGSMTTLSDPRLEGLANRLLVSASDELSGVRRREYLAAVDADIRSVVSQVGTPRAQTITLTAREGEIPLTVTSSADEPLTVRVTLVSDKLDFPDGASQVVTLADQNTTVLFAVRSRASGTFPLEVRLSSPDDRLELSTVRLTVRSTAVSNIGLLLSIGAGVFLVGWWALHFRSTRRARRLASPRPTPAERGAPGPV
ncbi:MAG: hypothetical protein IPM45_10270 [Acidimicrobiales bacterium]|nr:hypothetical protein [Acidimicrobiales bacterium]